MILKILTDMYPLLLALLPAVVLSFYIYSRDKQQPEPLGQLLKAFAYGCLSAFLALMLASPLEVMVQQVSNPVVQQVLMAFGVAAIPEEVAKLVCLYCFFRQCRFFDEYVDGIVYAVMVGLGFASIENILYLTDEASWVSVGMMRAIVSVPGHYAFAILMGYYYSLWHFDRYHNLLNRLLILVAPVLLHGTFDALLMLASLSEGLALVCMIAFLCFNRWMHKLASRKIQELAGR